MVQSRISTITNLNQLSDLVAMFDGIKANMHDIGIESDYKDFYWFDKEKNVTFYYVVCKSENIFQNE